MRALEIVFRILWSVALGGLIYGSTIWLLRVELSGDIERMEPGKAWLLRGLAWINAVVILVIGGMDGRLPEENRLVIQGAQEILCSLLAVCFVGWVDDWKKRLPRSEQIITDG